ncbi:ATP-binding protein [uncultured Comamonas sp.]|uniref:ATP-binding protein n=1 Tax=uncultured Comamonas sp. TaxID=114710 RepID=UPI003749AB7D
MPDLGNLVNVAATQGNPIDALRTFLQREEQMETARRTADMRFVGYVLELGFDSAKIITSDPYKIAVGGIPRGTFLIMTPTGANGGAQAAPPHFTLLRVTGVSPTPLSNQVQQTYFELHKKSMPELDVWTQSELQWGALDCDVLGMFYANPANMRELHFSGDVNNVVSAHRYKVFAPDEALLKLIVNGMVKPEQQAAIGNLRTMECGLFSTGAVTGIEVSISMKDFKGCRTAMFGKTRLGKSNVVKLLTQAMLDATAGDNSVGQLIFDINGEYANDNPQDGNRSIRSANEARCQVYALTTRTGTPSRSLRLNFYEQPAACLEVLASLLDQDNQRSNYIRSFASVSLPDLGDIAAMNESDRTRAVRKIQAYWACLNKAGFHSNETRLGALRLRATQHVQRFDCHFSSQLRTAAYVAVRNGAAAPNAPANLDELQSELEVIAQFRREDPNNALFTSSSGRPVFDPEMTALLEFLNPATGSGPSVLRAYQQYHSADAGNFQTEILQLLDEGKTVILDLGNATDSIRRYFSNLLSTAVFRAQEAKFVSNDLGNRYVQLYFEEAHNLFPPESKDLTGVYARFAKEGAKFHIGMVYSTQSPSTINKELLAQTENFFVGHLSSQDEVKSLARVQIAFSGVEDDILRAKTPGYMRMLTMSHRFVIPTQAFRFEARPAAGAPAAAPTQR